MVAQGSAAHGVDRAGKAKGGAFQAKGSFSGNSHFNVGYRGQAGATAMPSGHILAAGGFSTASTILATSKLYDPVAGAFSPAGSLRSAKRSQTATLLTNGKVLVAGDTNNDAPEPFFATADLFQ